MLTLGWPDDPETVAEANANPDVFAHKTVGQVADHFSEVITRLDKTPAVIGHSFGGLLTQIVAGRGLAAVSVAIDPAPFRGVLPLPISTLRSSLPVLKNPLNRGRAVTLTLDEFKYGWANALGEDRKNNGKCRQHRKHDEPTATMGAPYFPGDGMHWTVHLTLGNCATVSQRAAAGDKNLIERNGRLIHNPRP